MKFSFAKATFLSLQGLFYYYAQGVAATTIPKSDSLDDNGYVRGSSPNPHQSLTGTTIGSTKRSEHWSHFPATTSRRHGVNNNFLPTLNRSLQQEPTLPNGIWTSRGYGFVFVATNNDGTFAWLGETQISCVVTEPVVTLDLLADFFGATSDLSNNDTVLTLTVGITSYIFDKSSVENNEYKGGCANGVAPQVDDPEYERDPLFAFDVFAQWFAQHYAHFEVRGVQGVDDWNSRTTTVRAELLNNSNITDEALLVAMGSLIVPLNDGHVSVFADDSLGRIGSGIEVLEEEVMDEYIALNLTDATTTFEEYYVNQVLLWLSNVGEYYLDANGFQGQFDVTPLYGKFAAAAPSCVGYLQFFDFAPNDYQAWKNGVVEAFTAFQDCTSLVIDIRINGGGEDRIGLEVASFLTNIPVDVFSKRALNRNMTDGGSIGYTEWQHITLQPEMDRADLRFTRPEQTVYLITSRETVSAAEIFTMAMRVLPQVTVVGQPTNGILSDILDVTLPNGWDLGLSNEEYVTVDGEGYEAIGIPPNVLLPTAEGPLPPLADRQQGVDGWLTDTLSLALADLPAGGDVVTSSPSQSPSTKAPTNIDNVDTQSPSLASAAFAPMEKGREQVFLSGAIVLVTVIMTILL